MTTLELPSQDRYPVVVEETRRYILWLDADNPNDAVAAFDADARDPGSDAMFSFDWESRTPDEFDWRWIERRGDGNWPGTMADAHVQTHRNHLRAIEQRHKQETCAAAGHPIPDDASGPLRWADYCGTCGDIDPASRTAVAA